MCKMIVCKKYSHMFAESIDAPFLALVPDEDERSTPG
jgi:hypothetical protein